MESIIKLTADEAKALRKLLSKNKDKSILLIRSHENGIGPATLVQIEDRGYNITDYSTW